LKKANIIDGVVDDFTPKCFVAPFYGKKGRPVKLGNQINPKKTKQKPAMKIYCPDMRETLGMTIVLTDPDAPSSNNPKWGEFCHWIASVKAVRPGDQDEGFEADLDEDSDIVKCKSHLFLASVLRGGLMSCY
jgi:hypothetical protein